jgi:menaquinol-cytochrome c reductase iron-sulfur subunit
MNEHQESTARAEATAAVPNRRDVFAILAKVIGGVIALILGVPALAYIFSPLRRRSEGETDAGFYDAGAWTDLPEGTPTRVTIEMTHRDGWAKSQFRHSVWVFKTGDDSAVVLSPICPHLGCPVNWNASRGEYACPCHASFFNQQGDVLAGPSPRGLDPLAFEIRNGRLWIRWIDFRQGTDNRESVSV